MAAVKREREDGQAEPPRTVRTRKSLFNPTPLASSSTKSTEQADLGSQSVLHDASEQRYSLRARQPPNDARLLQSPAKKETSADQTKSKSETSIPVKTKEETFFDASPRKSNKPIKRELEAHEAHPAPPKWTETYALILKQRRRIVAPVDTLGCEEAGNDDRRGDKWREEDGQEDLEDAARRKRFTTLVSLMLSSQTKDPVTAAAVANLQRQLPGGLSIDSIIAASDEQVSSAINKVGFWRRKTGYVKSAARILKSDFGGDVPKDVDDICSLPGVGPKMAYLCLQSAWQMNEGIGVDVHVHRITNRLGWHKPATKDAEQTRLNLQSWLPKPLHVEINRVLVGFGQVVCLPVSPRCDLCILGSTRLCPSKQKVAPNSVENRVKVEFLHEDDTGVIVSPFPHKFRYNLDLQALESETAALSALKQEGANDIKAQIKIEGQDGVGVLLADGDQTAAALSDGATGAVQIAVASADSSSIKQEALDW